MHLEAGWEKVMKKLFILSHADFIKKFYDIYETFSIILKNYYNHIIAFLLY